MAKPVADPLDHGKTTFEEFLLEEYRNIAQAHFAAGTTITQFFQYYLIVLGVPLTALGLAAKMSGDAVSAATQLLQSPVARCTFGMFFLVVGLVGFGMSVYIMNLRFDALLYAHAVNGIRKYFLETSSRPKKLKQYLVLPTDVDLPGYYEPSFFRAVVMAFALLDGVYIALAVLLFRPETPIIAAIAVVLFIILHTEVYKTLAERGRDSLEQANGKRRKADGNDSDELK